MVRAGLKWTGSEATACSWTGGETFICPYYDEHAKGCGSVEWSFILR